MALRVLLADQSSTVKQSIEIALQDFHVEVHAVTSGDEVIAAATKIKPDIVLVDTLLPKKNGYEVLYLLQKDAQLARIPRVVLWSGFIQLDETKLKHGNPHARLEKPFEAKALREIVTQHVGKLKSQPLMDFLDFPDLPSEGSQANLQLVQDSSWGKKIDAKGSPSHEIADEFADEFSKVPLKQMQKPPATKKQDAFDFSDLQMDKIGDDDNFSGIEEISANFGESLDEPIGDDTGFDTLERALAKESAPKSAPSEEFQALQEESFAFDTPQDEVALKVNTVGPSIEEFKIDLSDEELAMADDFSVIVPMKGSDEPGQTEAGYKVTAHGNETASHSPLPNAQLVSETVKSHLLNSLTLPEIETMVKAQVRQVVEEIAWKVIPEIATRLLREQIKALLKEEAQKIEGQNL